MKYTFIFNEAWCLMEISDLKVFNAVVASGGVSRAAEALNRVPSNVTARIQKLESELGKNLFIREKNRLRISPAGEQLLVYAQKIISLANEAVTQLDDQSPKGKLRLGTMEAVAASRLSSSLLHYHQRYPEVSLEVSTGATGQLINQVLKGNLDLALVADPAKNQNLETLAVYHETLVLVSNISHQPINQPCDLGEQPTLLGFNVQCAYRSRFENWAKAGGVNPNIIEISSYHTLLNCITAGMGTGVIPEKLLQVYPFKEGLKVHTLPKSIARTITHCIWRPDSLKPSLQAFNEILMSSSNISLSVKS